MTIDIALHKSEKGSVSVYCHSSDPETVKNVQLQIVIDAGLIQIVGIMPTLIIVQLSIGQVVQDVGKPVRNATYPVAIRVDSSFQISRSSDASLKRRDECHFSSNEPCSSSRMTFSSDKCGEAVGGVVAHTHAAEQAALQFQTDLESGRDIDYAVRGDNGEGKDHGRSI